ncbi:class I SAM-dependent methyltransferase [Nesterenkonia muleiensis]|uniref:class I SAM-dependent methyltransferase n=1 Tax=Nesterenkonia muleiensis TaxID=2282648 RepID=UPI00192E58C2|nr:class I SAM-dependent methyltransferase [Nesterenkonia muleiensis]
MTATMDTTKLDQFVGQMVGNMTGAAVCAGVWLGDSLGLYRALADAGPQSSDVLGSSTGCNGRLVREWLDGQAAAGLIEYDPATDTYELSPEATAVLADETSPAFVARGMNTLAAMFIDLAAVEEAFRSDGAMSWGDHHPCLFDGTEWFFRNGYRAMLTTEWIPALDGVDEKLTAGARVADIGCGHGASSVVLAEAYPASEVHGFDLHAPSVQVAEARAAEAGVSNRTTFTAADARGYRGLFDLICFFDCLHDMGDPLGAARHAREQLAPGGTVLLVEPFALDDRTENLTENPMAALLYHASSTLCTPNSLSQEVGCGLGAQAGEVRLREVFTQAGYSTFRRVAQTPLNLILEAKP